MRLCSYGWGGMRPLSISVRYWSRSFWFWSHCAKTFCASRVTASISEVTVVVSRIKPEGSSATTRKDDGCVAEDGLAFVSDDAGTLEPVETGVELVAQDEDLRLVGVGVVVRIDGVMLKHELLKAVGAMVM